MENKEKELIEIIKEISIGTKALNKENILERLNDIYSNNYRHRYSEIFKVLVDIDKSKEEYDTNYLSENILSIIDESENYNYDEVKNGKNIKKCISKLYDHISLEIQRIEYMKKIDNKTERHKEDLLNKLEEKDEELQDIKEKFGDELDTLKKASDNELNTLKEEIKNVDEEAMKKMGMYISVFTLIAGNIAVLFKGIEVSPIELGGLIFIINSILIISIRTLFYFVNKDKKVSKDTIIGCISGVVLGILCFIFSSTQNNNYIKRNITKSIENEYNYKFEKLDKKLIEYEKENYILKLENENLKNRIEKIENRK